ncbi:hypothetical protein SAMN05421810_110146 [Amycolatopsis arida]|uniref:Phosphatidic acid phosphatase type 2/haloperoxidase domain-containing protein n=1 Tax=Amycolatopsis arida TaxID=587909 RepID=A0A1I5ZUX9_9PSEU|nr:phosphatase PAP2 family protein [Amycolatopsis arida]TDX89379.1 PAP2 superfamily protein [Amycolatopsis arida]SFQ60153.1 hypothetical protein SAMN05421810_110146 [Amycolatopsis arida]
MARPPARTLATAAGAIGAASLTLLLGLWHAGEGVPGPVDGAVERAVDAAFAGRLPLLRLLVVPTEPPVLLVAVAAIVLLCALDRWWSGAALALAGPALAVAANTWVLKPAFGRHYADHLAYPSGHTVALVSVLTVLAVLARPGRARRAVVGAGVVLTVAAGGGMVGLHYHYATDVLGGAAFAVAVVLGLALLGLSRPPAARGPSPPRRPGPAR